VTREVLIPTKDRAGDGDNYTHPVKIDYNNPIQAILVAPNEYFKFETQDGKVGDHPGSTRVGFFRKEISPKDSIVSKIQVCYHGNYIQGFKFFTKDDTVVLEAGIKLHDMQEVLLQDGESLLGVKSKLYDKSTSNNTAHCNLVLIIGKL